MIDVKGGDAEQCNYFVYEHFYRKFVPLKFTRAFRETTEGMEKEHFCYIDRDDPEFCEVKKGTRNGPMTFVSKNYVSWQRQVSGGEPSGLKKESKSQQRRCPGIAVEPRTALAMNMSSSGVGPDQRGWESAGRLRGLR